MEPQLPGLFLFGDGPPIQGAIVEGIVEKTAHAVEEGIKAVPKMLGTTIRKGINAPAVPIENLRRPAVGIVYGARIQYHKEQIESLLDETDVLILGGEMIFALYKAQGLSVGSTTVSDEEIQLAKSILDKAKAKGLKLVLPTHVVVADSDDEYYANTKIVAASEIPDEWIGVDVAPATIELIADALKGAKTIVWNGSQIGSYSKSTTEGIEKLIEEHGEKGVWILLLGLSTYITRDGVGKRFQNKKINDADKHGVSTYTTHATAGPIFGFPMQKGSNSTEPVAIEDLNGPAAAIVGGAQVEDKKKQIEPLLDEIDVLILVGEMIFAFYKAQGLSIGSTSESDENVQLAKSILEEAKVKGVKIILPTHVVVADSDYEYPNTKIVAASEIPDRWFGVDMAPESMELIADVLKDMNTIVWNGEMGSSSYSDLTMEATEKLIEELGEKGVLTLVLDRTLLSAGNTDFYEKSFEEKKIDDAASKIGMFHFGG